jgi:hypothetical protein
MAMKSVTKTEQSPEQSKVRLAGAAATLLALAGTAGSVFWLIWHLSGSETRSETVAYLLFLTAFAGLGLLAGLQLLRGKLAVQQALLVYWLGVAVAAIVLTLGVILWKVPEGVAKELGGTAAGLAGWATLLGVVVIGLAGGMCVLLVAASEPGTRQRYGSVVIVSVAVVIALMVAVNLLAQYESPATGRKNFVHSSWETLGRYGLGERTKKILSDLKTPVRLTCVYTSTDEAKKTDELRPRVLELLDDMKIYGENITVENITADADKARLLGRLRGQLGSSAEQHDKLVRKFDKEIPGLLAKLAAGAKAWEGYPPDSYLEMWSLPMEMANAMSSGIEKLQAVKKKVSEGLAGPGLPNYAELTGGAGGIKEACKDLQGVLDKSAELVKKIDKIAKAAADPAKLKVAQATIEQCAAAVTDVAKNLAGAASAPAASAPTTQGANPADMLARHVTAERRAAQLATAAANQLDNLAGEDMADLLRENRYFAVGAGNVQVALSDYYRLIAQTLTRDADEAAAILKNAKAEYQAKFLTQARLKAGQAVQLLAKAQEAAAALLKRLGTVEERSKADMALAEQGKLFAEPLAKLKATIEAIDKLPTLKGSSVSTDISGENIVVVEAGGKVEVVPFDEVWPMKNRPMGPSAAEDTQQGRVFNGDAAIGSRILSMTNKPFATVYFTFWTPGPDMPPQMARMIPPADIPVEALSTIRKRLEESNFQVKDWNLSGPMPDANDAGDAKDGKDTKDAKDAKDRPKMLIVLPAPPEAPQNPFQRTPQPLPKFMPEHAEKVAAAIGRGIPAIFLATFSPPRQANMFSPPMAAPYAWNNYLRDAWGLEAQTDYLVIPAVTDDKTPGKYKVDGQRFSYLPLSSFSDFPIGKPLQAQRVMWANLCPVMRKKDARGDIAPPPPGVNVQSVLGVPADWKSTWATRRIQELLAQFQNGEGSYIWPIYEAGDMPAPFDVAVAATRAEDKAKGVSPARIVVLCEGQSLMDGYLDREVAVRDAKGTISLTDPPRADADLLLNSAYWLIGRQNLIASGPVQATMKEIPQGLKLGLVLLYCGALPAVVLGIGGLVLLKRKR